ncbi:MAG: nucleoside monophosphate kinase [bacterium]|nr:nucleoside monophosphate kinase [bacterium]
MKLVLIGIQGAGKSTQGNLLSRQLNIPYLSTGHIFRDIAKEKTSLGRYVKELMSSGALIPDGKVIEIVNSYLSKPGYKKGYILDGFPRTIAQAKEFINNVDQVIHIEIPDKEALWRLAYRNEKRDDDTIIAIKKRIEMFKIHTIPVLNYYEKQDRLSTIDGTLDIKEVNQAILKSLGKQLVKNRIHVWKQKSPIILCIVGMPGSGKSEAADYFRKKGIPAVSFSDIVNSTIEKSGKPHTLKNHHEVRQGLRSKHGFEAMAKLSKVKIEKALETKSLIVIQGMRSWEEYEYIMKEFPKTRVFILCLYADKAKRYKRIKKRGERSSLSGPERDLDELINTHMGPTIAYADFVVKNNYSRDDLQHKLEEVYREVYFS